MNKKVPLAMLVLLMVGLAGGYTFAVLTTQKDIPTSANVVTDVNLGVYEDDITTIELTFIDWQNILPTEIKTKTIWIENLADISMSINVTTKDWNPEYAKDTMTFTVEEGSGWVTGYPTLYPHERSSLILSLIAGENPPSGTFSFTIVIEGTSV